MKFQPTINGIAVNSADSGIQNNLTARLADAHNRANENAQRNRRRRTSGRRVTGSVRLSNTDSLGRANRIRQRLRAKVNEIMSSTVEPEIRESLARSVQMQLDRVENKIRQIRRRERAEQEEKRDRQARERRKEDARLQAQRDEARRRRRNEMRQRSINIRRDLLYPANRGGFDPYRFSPANNFGHPVAVSYSVGGVTGTVSEVAVAADVGSVDIVVG